MAFKYRGFRFAVEVTKIARSMVNDEAYSWMGEVRRAFRSLPDGGQEEFDPEITEIHGATVEEAIREARDEAKVWIDRKCAELGEQDFSETDVAEE